MHRVLVLHLLSGLLVLAADRGGSSAAIHAYDHGFPFSATPDALHSEPIHVDDFSDSSTGWPEGGDDAFSYGYTGGEYRLSIRDEESVSWVTGSPFFADFDAEVSARFEAAEVQKSYGLIFGLTDIETFLLFELDPSDSTYAVRQHTSDGWNNLVEWASSTAIHGGSASNTLRVVRRRADIRIMANGEQLAALEIPDATAGRLGFLVANYSDPTGAEAFFDDLRVFADDARDGTSLAYMPSLLSLASGSPKPVALPPAGGVFGRVSINTEPAARIALQLVEYDEEASSIVGTTFTSADGRYVFDDVPDLPAGKAYFVKYGPNTDDPRLLFQWFGSDIVTYTSGASVSGGDFDLGNVMLVSPPTGTALSPPYAYRWHPRPVADTYRLRIFDPEGSDAWITNDLGHVGQSWINMPEGAELGKEYGWSVRAYYRGGFGDAYYYSRFTFEPGVTVVGPKSIGSHALLLTPRLEPFPLRLSPGATYKARLDLARRSESIRSRVLRIDVANSIGEKDRDRFDRSFDNSVTAKAPLGKGHRTADRER